MLHIQNPVYYRRFRHIKAYLEPCVTLAYSEPCHIQTPGIFRTQDIFRTRSWHILVYSERCLTLPYWEPSHIQNTFYTEQFLHNIQAYSVMIVTITISFLFFTSILHTFQQNLKWHLFVDTITSISMLDCVYLHNTPSLKKTE